MSVGLAETKVYICLALDNEHQLIVNDLSHHFEIIIIQTKIIFCCWNGVEIVMRNFNKTIFIV